MARLSTPAADTPKSERKSNRFREIFKHRASTSASSTPARFIEASQAIDPSPSPSVKPGFQKIGLLPCERISLSSLGNLGKGSYEGTIKAEPTVSKEHDGGPVSVPVQDKKIANLIDNGEPNAGCQGSTGFEFPLQVPNNAQRSSLPPNSPHRIAEAMHAKSGSARSGSSIRSKKLGNGSFLNYDLIQPQQKAQILGPDQDFDDDSVFRKSAPSTISGQEGSVRAKNHEHKIHEHKILEHMSHESKNHQYIRKQIAEALFEYDKEHHRSDSQRSTAASITFNIDIRGISAVKAMQDNRNRSGNILSVVNSSIGPVTIAHSRLARYLQLSIMAFYTILLVASAFLGPKTLALAVWRMAIGLGVYAVAVWRLGWAGRLERDVLLAPVFFAFSVAQGVGGQLLEKLLVEVATAISGGPKHIEGGEGVRFDGE